MHSEELKRRKICADTVDTELILWLFADLVCGVASKKRVPTAESIARPSHGSET